MHRAAVALLILGNEIHFIAIAGPGQFVAQKFSGDSGAILVQLQHSIHLGAVDGLHRSVAATDVILRQRGHREAAQHSYRSAHPGHEESSSNKALRDSCSRAIMEWPLAAQSGHGDLNSIYCERSP